MKKKMFVPLSETKCLENSDIHYVSPNTIIHIDEVYKIKHQ